MAGVADHEVTGKMGRVIVRVRGSKGPGEVLVRVRGGSEAFIAYADIEIERGTDVLVIHSRGERAVDVLPWADAMDLETPALPGD